MMPIPPSLGAFVLRTFLWLPACFALWYFGARHHAAIAGDLARRLLNLLNSGLVSSLEQSGFDLVFVTSMKIHPAPGQTAVLAPEVNPLLYTYGLALFLALVLAARTPLWKVLAGAAALLPFQAWGIAFDVLVQVGIGLGPGDAAQAGLLGLRREAVALGYQVGSLLFPSLVPIVLWAAMSRAFIERLVNAVPPPPPVHVPGTGGRTPA